MSYKHPLLVKYEWVLEQILLLLFSILNTFGVALEQIQKVG